MRDSPKSCSWSAEPVIPANDSWVVRGAPRSTRLVRILRGQGSARPPEGSTDFPEVVRAPTKQRAVHAISFPMRLGFLSRFPCFATHALLVGLAASTLVGCLPATFNVRAA